MQGSFSDSMLVFTGVYTHPFLGARVLRQSRMQEHHSIEVILELLGSS